MTNNSNNSFWCKEFIIPNIIGIFLMITPLYIPEIPHWIAGIIFWGSFVILAGILLLHIRDFYKIKISNTFLRSKIPLDEASLIAYEQLRGYPISTISEIVCKDNPLQYIANHIAENCELWGTYSPSRKLEIVDKEQMGRIKEAGKYTTLNNGKDVVYNSLLINRKHLKQYIKQAKNLVY